MKYILFSSLLFLSLLTFGQLKKDLTKTQMFEDFDYLVDRIAKISPHIIPKKQLWKYDIIQEIKNRRTEIDTITNYNSFWFLINRTLNSCQDGHTVIKTENKGFNIYQNFKISLPIKYINGEYLVNKPFSFNDIHFQIGAKVEMINNEPIHDYVQKIPQFRYFMQWDNLNKRFFYSNFYANDNIAMSKFFSISIVNLDNSISTLQLKTSDEVIIDSTKSDFNSVKKVEYWQEQKILYIRVPAMNSDDINFYKKEIISKSKSKIIDKIIIDIRNNLGGSDSVWQAIYETILDEPVKYSLKLYGNNPDFMTKEYIKDKNLNLKKIKSENLSFLNNQKMYIYYDKTETIKPSKKSIRFKGKIFVVGNENIFSSAGSCMILPNENANDNIISVGRETGRFLGGGYDPISSILPNSKIDFIIEPAIDITKAKKVKDIMHDNYEINIPYNIAEFQDKFNYNGNIWSQQFMIKYDPFIKEALSR